MHIFSFTLLALQLFGLIAAAPYQKTLNRAEWQTMAVRAKPFLGRKLYIEQLNNLARSYEENGNLLKAELHKLIADEAIDVYCPERFDLNYNDEEVQEIIKRFAMKRYDQRFSRMAAVATLNLYLKETTHLDPQILSMLKDQIDRTITPEEYEITMHESNEVLSRSRDAELTVYYAKSRPGAQHRDIPLDVDFDDEELSDIELTAMRKRNFEATFEAEYGRFTPGPPPYALSASPYYFEAPPSYEDVVSR